MSISSVNSSSISMVSQISEADKAKFAAAAKKAGVTVKEGQKLSNEDMQKLKKAGIDIKA
jgi:uncharacterized protein YdbL (DUF1318 family)